MGRFQTQKKRNLFLKTVPLFDGLLVIYPGHRNKFRGRKVGVLFRVYLGSVIILY